MLRLISHFKTMGLIDIFFNIPRAKGQFVSAKAYNINRSKLLNIPSEVLEQLHNVEKQVQKEIKLEYTFYTNTAEKAGRLAFEIEKLGYNKDDYMLSGINAAQSPITFLYQQFSRTERSKRQVAEMKNEDRKRELLKELFRLYVDYEIIKLSDDEFDSFIDFVNVSDEFLKSSSQYDFLLYVKDRFNDYKIWKRNNAMDDGDFEYDKD